MIASKILLLLILSYILGSIPFGLIFVKLLKGVDIRGVGSGNIGATNVTRTAGLQWGITVFVLDFLKGLLPVFFAFLLLPKDTALCRVTSIVVGLSAIAGHNWPVFLKFKGGKGVSTSMGVIASLSINLEFLRTPLILTILAWLIVFYFSRQVGLASLVCACVFFIGCLVMVKPPEFKLLSFLVAFFIFIRHKQNIRDLAEMYKIKKAH